jgi:hypothetical protein
MFGRGHTALELGNPIKNTRSSHFVLSKIYFQFLEIVRSIFPQFEANFFAGTLSFQVCHFLRNPESLMEEYTHFSLIRLYLPITPTTALFGVRNDLADCIYECT